MAQATFGSLRIGRVAGIDVYVHWTWALMAYFELVYRSRIGPVNYQSEGWNAIELLALFGIVLLHEFGHALACRSVGGRANRVVLWLLGGAAMVEPPPRPGAVLWAVAAGPLVNFVLAPILLGLAIASTVTFGPDADVSLFLKVMTALNIVLFVFNLLPIYPLDGGQILYALLWFVVGRVRSLVLVSSLGLAGGLGVVILAVLAQDYWLGVMAVFVAVQCLMGFRQAQVLSRMLNSPRHEWAHCPSCGQSPFVGNFWVCDRCRARFDAFEHRAQCPGCRTPFPTTMCPSCRQRHLIAEWLDRVLLAQEWGDPHVCIKHHGESGA